MCSSSETWARPVRTVPSSLRKSSTAFSMRALDWAAASLVLAIVIGNASVQNFAEAELRGPIENGRRQAPPLQNQYLKRLAGNDERADLFTHQDALDVAGHIHIEDDDRHFVVHAKRNGRG